MKQGMEVTDSGNTGDRSLPEIAAMLKAHPDNYWTLRNRLILVTTLGSAMSLFLAIVSIILAWWAASQSSKTQYDLRAQDLATQKEIRDQDYEMQLALKEIDLRQYCQVRYDELSYDARVKVKTQSDAEGYYKRFWDLQFEQYQYCKAGFIDSKIFSTWMDSRRLEHKEDKSVGPMSYKAGWTHMADSFRKHDDTRPGLYTEFVDFMNDVFVGAKTTCERTVRKP